MEDVANAGLVIPPAVRFCQCSTCKRRHAMGQRRRPQDNDKNKSDDENKGKDANDDCVQTRGQRRRNGDRHHVRERSDQLRSVSLRLLSLSRTKYQGENNS